MNNCTKCIHSLVCNQKYLNLGPCKLYEKERPNGEWVADDWIRDVNGEFCRLYSCSKCGYKAIKHYPFCVCGADMRKGGRE